MYKALVVAFDKGIITDKECRWDEGVTKADFMEMLTNTYLAMPTQVSADQGSGEEPVTIVEEETTEGGTTVILGEDDYKGDDPYDTGDVDFEGMTRDEKVQQIISDYIKKNTQQQGNWSYTPGATIDDPSKDGQYHLGEGGEVPDHLKGAVIK